MALTKRVTVTVELVDTTTGRTEWAHTETAEHTTGNNPLHHWSDASVAMTSAGNRAREALIHRFGDFREL
jgi:hypothetical protein